MNFTYTYKAQVIPPNIQNRIAEELRLVAYLCGNAIANFSPIASGQLQKSFTSSALAIVEEVKNDKSVVVTFASPLWGKPMGYGAYVEFGTRPHWAPLSALLNWVRIKGLVKRSSSIKYIGGKTTRVKETRAYRIGKEISIARMIQYKIAAKGTRPQKYVAEALATMGLQHEVEVNATDIFYRIDPTPILVRMGSIERIFK